MFWQASKDAVPDTRLFLSYRKLRFHTTKKTPRGCALGARVDGCRGNRASARECAKAHSFGVTVDGITKGGPAGVLLPAGMKKKYFRKSFSLSMLLSYKSDVTGV